MARVSHDGIETTVQWADIDSEASKGFHRVMVPLDGGDFAEQAIPLACRIAGPDACIYLIRVVTSPDLGMTDVPPSVAKRGRPPHPRALDGSWFGADVLQAIAYLEQVAARVESDKLYVDWEVRHGLIDYELLRAANEHSIDAIAMSSHDRSTLVRLVRGGIANHLIRNSGKPVLVYRPKL